MIVDGRAVAEKLKGELRTRYPRIGELTLAVIVTGADAVTKSYVGIKKKVAADLGVSVIDATTMDEAMAADGIILQLPLPPDMDVEVEKNKMPVEKDVDVLSDAAVALFEKGGHPAVPPVPAGMQYLLTESGTPIYGSKVAIVGYGRLVGKPAAVLFKQLGATVEVAQRGDDVGAITRDADIVILGTGVAGILTPDMVKEGVAIMDAGASELGGKVVGDADPRCADKAAVLTPVPGGVGPVAVTKIFENLAALAEMDKRP